MFLDSGVYIIGNVYRPTFCVHTETKLLKNLK